MHSLLFSSLLIPFDSANAAGVLPDTGQAKCYNNTGVILCPAPGEAFYGQDGNYQGPQPAYQVSANGLVVSDLNTGLMWQRADDGVERTWDASVSYCEGLVLGGYSDWRLPSVQELFSIVDYGEYPYFIDRFVSSCKEERGYWSGTTDVTLPSEARVVACYHPAGGRSLKTESFFVRCVRGRP